MAMLLDISRFRGQLAPQEINHCWDDMVPGSMSQIPLPSQYILHRVSILLLAISNDAYALYMCGFEWKFIVCKTHQIISAMFGLEAVSHIH